ncbi:immunoglobulin A1 protease autotransporter [Hemibagrus wyckioides]|nr:immunoglobulin A1 protease autotransporter [Hemibagrus wyckioides]
MESTPGEGSGNTEDVTGRKKSRFRFLKVRLFGRLKKKEAEGRMKQSQSTGDVTAQEGGRGEDDSEDDCHYPEGALSSRALSHDSIFLADPGQSSQPARVLSQENVHSKIKALQLKLQQQNMRLAPPLLIPGKRMEDSGTTSEDDGLPRSPPEMSFQEVAMRRGASKYPEAKSQLSLLSLGGTGSEEEEQGGFSQPSSRPLSPVPYLSITESPSPGVDFTSPAQYVPILDNSAARHRMSIKPRNQRASTKGKKPPNLYRPRSSSMNSVDETLSEKEETRQNVTPTHHYSYTSEESTQAEEPLEESEKVTLLTASPRSPLIKNTEPIQHEDKTNTVSSDEITVLHASNHTGEPLAKEPSNDINKININEDQASLIPLSICSLDTASDYNVRKERTDSSFAASSIDQMESPKSPKDLDVSKPLETITRLHPVPVPAPRTKTPTLSNLNKVPPKVSGLKPVEAEKDTPSSSGLAESPIEDDKPLRPSSFRFSIASAKYRSKTSDENVAKQDEENSGYTQKSQSYNQNLVVQMEKVETTKSNEACRNIPSAPDKRNSLGKDIVVQNVSKTGVVDNPEKSEGCTQNTDYLKAEEPEDRRGLFGVKLRSTSLCLKYRSELPRTEAEMKRHSLEGELVLAVKEPVSSDVEAIGNDRKVNVQQSLDIQQDPSLDKGSEADRRPEPAWKSLTREKARVHQSFRSKSPTQPASPTSLCTPPSSSTQQLSKPALQPRPQLPSTSKPQPVTQSSQQIPPKTAPRAMERWTNQREEKSSVSQSAQRDELLDNKGQSKPGAKSNTQTEPDQQPPSDRAEPTWMELAKRKSLAWSDKTLEFMNF